MSFYSYRLVQSYCCRYSNLTTSPRQTRSQMQKSLADSSAEQHRDQLKKTFRFVYKGAQPFTSCRTAVFIPHARVTLRLFVQLLTSAAFTACKSVYCVSKLTHFLQYSCASWLAVFSKGPSDAQLIA